MKGLMDDFGRHFFPNSYNADSGLIEFDSSLGQLKEGIAEVGDLKALTHPRIKFFADKNPDWRSGVELACIAEMTFLMPLQYGLKKAWIHRIRPSSSGKALCWILMFISLILIENSLILRRPAAYEQLVLS